MLCNPARVGVGTGRKPKRPWSVGQYGRYSWKKRTSVKAEIVIEPHPCVDPLREGMRPIASTAAVFWAGGPDPAFTIVTHISHSCVSIQPTVQGAKRELPRPTSRDKIAADANASELSQDEISQAPGNQRRSAARSGFAESYPGPMTFSCPQCGQPIAAEPGMAGMQTTCPACGQEASIPSTGNGADAGTGAGPGCAASSRGGPLTRYECPKCHSTIEVADIKVGASVLCPVCSLVFLVPRRRSLAPGWACRLRRWVAICVLIVFVSILGALWAFHRIGSGGAPDGADAEVGGGSGETTSLQRSARSGGPTYPDNAGLFRFPQVKSGGRQQHASANSILGTWLIDPARAGSLGAFEMLARSVGDTNVPQMTLVVSQTSILHRYKKAKEAPFQLLSARAEITNSRDHHGAEYAAIRYAYSLTPHTTPSRIDLRFTGPRGEQRSYGIYRLERDRLWLCFPAAAGDTRRPRDWSNDGTSTRIILGRRID